MAPSKFLSSGQKSPSFFFSPVISSSLAIETQLEMLVRATIRAVYMTTNVDRGNTKKLLRVILGDASLSWKDTGRSIRLQHGQWGTSRRSC